MNLLRGFLDNDSIIGQILLRLWAIIICNLCFVLTTIPVVTAGAGWAAMDYALMNTLKNNNTAAPFRDFWKGFRTNFKQATVSWLAALVLAGILGMEWYWCRQFGGIFEYFGMGILVIAACALIILLYLFPTMAAFEAPLGKLIGSSIYFALNRPVNLIIIIFVHIVPMALTYIDLQRLPLYAFLWCFFGFAAVSLVSVSLLLKQYMPYLAKNESRKEEGDKEQDPHKKSEAEILREMRKMGM
jgi:uncharacterized membrane protein YesL